MKTMIPAIAACLFACGGAPASSPSPGEIHPGACGLPFTVKAGDVECVCGNCACDSRSCNLADGGACPIQNPDGGATMCP